MAGTLVRCHECGGGGLLLRPDPEELETLRAAPKDEAGATEPAPARSEFRAADLLRQAIADRLGYDRDADWPSDDVMIRALAEAGAPAEPTGDIDRDAS
jgi:hypothetical protein